MDVKNDNWPPASATTPRVRPKGVGSGWADPPKALSNDVFSGTNSNSNFANFANVFQTPSISTSTSDPFLDQSNNNNNESNKNGGNSDLFADFNDNFEVSTTSKRDTAMTTTTTKQAFDPFGVSTTMTTSSSSNNNNFSATFDDDPFGDAFPKASSKNGTEKKSVNNSKVINTNKGQSNVRTADQSAKFSEDYSKNFDTDLEEVLKRSLFDQ